MGKLKDPYAAREAAKYDNPIPSREFIIAHLKKRKTAANLRELYTELQLTDPERQEALRRRIKAMLRDNQVEQLSKRRYWPMRPRRLVEGTISVDRKKAIWLLPDAGGARILLPRFTAKRVYQGNRVIVSIPKAASDKAPLEGKLVEILAQPNMVVTGRFITDAGLYYVVPYHSDIVQEILIPPEKSLAATVGQIVVVEIVSQHSRRSELIGHVIEILGDENTPGIEVAAVIRKYQLPTCWPEAVETSMAKINTRISAALKRQRVDLTELPLVTIDGEDARDFDDAVYCEPKAGGGWRLYVAIADVGYYVKENSALDQEAQQRGNSVYFPLQVIPMLPEVLSNGLCSLKPNEERLCVVCEMTISQQGKLTRYEFYDGIMKSQMRFTYNKVAQLLAGAPELQHKYADFIEDLQNLHALYCQLRAERERRGAIDFETVETRIIFSKNSKIHHIEPVERTVAHRIIEECMLCANVATARFLAKHKIPALYRNHEGPAEDKVIDLRVFLSELGLGLGQGRQKKPTSIDYGMLLKRIKSRPDAQVIQTVLLRSLCQAVYSPDNLGHFGLAYAAYSHFTSPIRRYPDLIVHRQIRAVLQGKWHADLLKTEKGKNKSQKMQETLVRQAQHCSMTERRADDATRDVINALKCQYMQQHIGGIFPGMIVGVTRFGFFVELTDYYVEGLVHINSLADDYYLFDAVHHRLTGERSGKMYQLGTAVVVQVAKVNTQEAKLDFVLVKKNKIKKNSKNKAKRRQRTGQK